MGANFGMMPETKIRMMIAEETLNSIWNGCLQNNRKQEELLYKTMAPRMLAVCMRYTNDQDEARDVMQEGFVKAFKKRHCFCNKGSLEGWIRRIMVHTAISRYRKQKRLVLRGDMLELDTPFTHAYEYCNLEAKDLLRMIQQLPDHYRSVFNMYAIEGYSHQEIGDRLGITELLSRTILHRARAVLKNKLQRLKIYDAIPMAG